MTTSPPNGSNAGVSEPSPAGAADGIHSCESGVTVAVALALLAVSAFMRVYRLGTLPGINGDEAWLGLAARELAARHTVFFQTPTGNFVNPIFLLTEWPLTALCGPSLSILRWPAMFWNFAGLLAFGFLYRRALGRPREALLATVTLACLPLHLCNSRIGWDSSFVLPIAAVMLCAALAVAERGWRPGWAALLAAAALAAVWAHMTTLVFVALVGVGLWGIGLRRALRGEAAGRRRRALGSLLGAGLLGLGTIAGGALLAHISHHPFAGWLQNLTQGVVEAARSGGVVLMELFHQSIVLSGQRAFEYFAGKPPGALSLAWSALCLAIYVTGGVVLSKAPNRRSDWCLGIIVLASVPAIILLRGFFHLEALGRERYILWLAPLFAVVLARLATLLRGLLKWCPTAALLALAAVNLGLTGRYYLAALARLEYRTTLHETFWTGPEEPKMAAARIIAAARLRGPVAGVWAQDRWTCYPLRFLLTDALTVRNATDERPPAALPAAAAVILVGWPKDQFLAVCLNHYAQQHGRSERIDIPGGDGQAVLSVAVVQAPAAR